MAVNVDFASLLAFQAESWQITHVPQPLQRYGTGLEVERLNRTGVTPGVIGDMSGGLVTSPGVVNWQAYFNRFRYNQGVQLRYPGAAVLPFVLSNQASVTNDVDISTFNTNGVRAHGILSTAGGTRYLVGMGTKLYRADTTTGAMAVASINVDGGGSATAFAGNVTCVAQGPVGGTQALVVALAGTADILYTTDVTASPIIFTTLKTMSSSSDWIAAMEYMNTVGPGTWVLVGQLDGVDGVFSELGSTPAATWSPQQATLDDFIGQLPQAEVFFTAATSPSTGANDASAGDVAWTDPTNITSSNDTRATSALTAGQTTQFLVASGFSFTGPAAGDQIVGVVVEVERSSTATGNETADYECQLRVSGTAVGMTKRTASPLISSTDSYRTFGAFDDPWFAELTGADLANLSVAYRAIATATETANVDHIRVSLAYRKVAFARVIETSRRPLGVRQSDLAITPSARWVNPENAIVSDGSFATWTSTGADATSNYLIAGPFFTLGELPSNMLVQGIQINIERSQSSSTANVEDLVIQLFSAGALVGANQAVLATEWNLATAAEYELTFGRDGYTWDVEGLTGADMLNISVAIRVLGDLNNAQIDAISMSIDGVLPGQTTSFDGSHLGGIGASGLGSVVNGWMVSRNPTQPNRVAVVSGGEMWFIDCGWDTNTNRVAYTFSQPNEGMAYVHHAAPYLGGYILTGGNSIGAGNLVKVVTPGGDVLDYSFPQYHGATAVVVNSVMSQGAWAILDVVSVNSSGTVTDRQWWYMSDKKYFPDTILQSLSESEAGTGRSSIAALPIAWSTQPVYSTLNYTYTVFPNATDTAWSRVKTPSDLGSDPRITNTTWIKSQGFDANGVENVAIYFEPPQWDIGPAEANKTMLTLQYLDRWADDATAYGAIAVSLSTDNGANFTALNTFDTAFEKHNLASGGTAYRTAVWRFSLTHQAGTAETPNALPFVFETDQQWPNLRTFRFYVDPAQFTNQNTDLIKFWQNVTAALNTKSVGTLKVSTIRDNVNTTTLGAVATLSPQIDWAFAPKVPAFGDPLAAQHMVADASKRVMVMTFEERPGSIT